jgi:hypothetical protein
MRSAAKALTLTAAALGLALLSSPAHATPVAPGQTVTPTAAANPLTGTTILASSVNQPYSASLNGNSIAGTASAWVVTGYSGNPFGTQFDTFVYQVTFTSGTNAVGTSPILERVTGGGYDTVFSTDATYSLTTSPTGQVAPTTADRSTNGNVMGFNFIPPGSPIPLGGASALLIVNTNATNFHVDTMSIQDGISANANAFGPSPAVSPVPEPSTLALTGLGTLGFVAYGLRRRRGRIA